MEPSKELAYWVGVAQSDGHYKICNEKRGENVIERHIIQLGVSIKSLPMLKKFETISQKIFGTSGNYCIDKRKKHRFEIKIKRFLDKIKKVSIDFSDPPKPPSWCIRNIEFFGAYMAGVIDGDGDVRVTRPQYPQCAVRITSGKEQKDLRVAIINMLGCGCSYRSITKESQIDGRNFIGTGHVIEFYISPKNFKFTEKFILPEMTIPYKRNMIKEYIELKTG
ncbi:hypothetical protein K8R33_04765 [archaeon]|nr:hypothetical protein [archaeon]